jgi:hypothetical protein
MLEDEEEEASVCSTKAEPTRDAVMDPCRARLLKPSRVSDLTLQEEKVRTELTLQNFGRQLWLASFAGEDELKEHVADPAAFVSQREDLVIGFSDQVVNIILCDKKVGDHKHWHIAYGYASTNGYSAAYFNHNTGPVAPGMATASGWGSGTPKWLLAAESESNHVHPSTG